MALWVRTDTDFFNLDHAASLGVGPSMGRPPKGSVPPKTVKIGETEYVDPEAPADIVIGRRIFAAIDGRIQTLIVIPDGEDAEWKLQWCLNLIAGRLNAKDGFIDLRSEQMPAKPSGEPAPHRHKREMKFY